MAIGVISPAGLELAGDTTETFSWASVTKLVTSLAILLALEEATLSLDDLTGPYKSSIRNLLSHSSGIGPRPFAGLDRNIGLPQRSLSGRYVEGKDLEELQCPPETKRIYSNLGFEILAGHLEARSQMSFAEYLIEGVLEPLSMMNLARPDNFGSPAHGARGTIGDLMVMARELLNPELLSPETTLVARTACHPGLSGILPGFGHMDDNSWGLGFEIKSTKEPHWTSPANTLETFGHFGQSGAFVWIDPVNRVAFGYLSERPFDSWARDNWHKISSDVLTHFG